MPRLLSFIFVLLFVLGDIHGSEAKVCLDLKQIISQHNNPEAPSGMTWRLERARRFYGHFDNKSEGEIRDTLLSYLNGAADLGYGNDRAAAETGPGRFIAIELTNFTQMFPGETGQTFAKHLFSPAEQLIVQLAKSGEGLSANELSNLDDFFSETRRIASPSSAKAYLDLWTGAFRNKRIGAPLQDHASAVLDWYALDGNEAIKSFLKANRKIFEAETETYSDYTDQIIAEAYQEASYGSVFFKPVNAFEILNKLYVDNPEAIAAQRGPYVKFLKRSLHVLDQVSPEGLSGKLSRSLSFRKERLKLKIDENLKW